MTDVFWPPIVASITIAMGVSGIVVFVIAVQDWWRRQVLFKRVADASNKRHREFSTGMEAEPMLRPCMGLNVASQAPTGPQE